MATEERVERVADLDIYMEAQRLAVVATAAIERVMELAGLSRSKIAEAIDVPKSRVTKALDGETNMTLKTLAQFGLACGVRWQFVGVKADDPTVIVTAPESLLGGQESPYVVTPDEKEAVECVAAAAGAQAHEPSGDYSLAA